MVHSFENILHAFEFVSSAPADENQAILNCSTGEIVCKTGMLDEEEFPEEVEASDNFVWIPHRDDLDLGRGLVFDFVELSMPREKKIVRRMFRFWRKNGFRNFLDFLGRAGKLDEWRAFEKQETRYALLDWCDDNEIDVDVEE
jgi:dissimilatory sulfite reductase (desulfoviridin) alpha/beta subunit